MYERSDVVWPYGERNGVGAQDDAEILLAPSEIDLSDEDRQLAREFAADLYEGRLPHGMKVDDDPRQNDMHGNLADLRAVSVLNSTTAVYSGYLETPTGYGEAFVPGYTVSERRLASRSLAWQKQELAERLAHPVSEDANWPDQPVMISFNDLEPLLRKYEGLQYYRQLYRRISSNLSDHEPSDLVTVQRTLLNIHWSRVNEMTAQLYPVLLNAADWLADGDDDASTVELRARVNDASGVAAVAATKNSNERNSYMESVVRRMDYISNGAARNDRGITPVSNELANLADEIESGDMTGELPAAEISDEVIEAMRGVRWNADQLTELAETVISSWGLLSDDRSDWEEVRLRNGPAEDGAWQVVITEDRSALEVSSVKKVVLVPAKFNRMLLQSNPAGALPVLAHELEHLLQAEYDERLADQIPLAKVGGSKHVTNREMGGVYEERALHAMVGQARPVNTTYVRAMQAKVAGGNQTEVARAFAEVHRGDTPEARALAAGKNVMRLYRHSRRGGHDSQALDYAEQELILRGLEGLPDDKVAAIAMAGGSFSLRDMAELHKVGMLDLPETVPVRPSRAVMDAYLMKYHPDVAARR